MESAADIAAKALELGYEKCGLISIEDLDGFGEKLQQRFDKFPQIIPASRNLTAFLRVKEQHPWARTVIVAVWRYSRYHIPRHLGGLIGKYYLADCRHDARAEGFIAAEAFSAYLDGLGLKHQNQRDFGLVPLRWAAQMAGLGRVRRNNFFYTQNGSWNHLEGWLVDRPLEHKETPSLKDCHEKCRLCVKACPTGSLDGPYSMNRNSCVSCLTTWDGDDFTKDPYSRKMGGWLFGCDACQDSCPHNKGLWLGDKEFPGLNELAPELSLEKVLTADYEFLEKTLQPKLWYIPQSKLWKFKTNALNAMLNTYRPQYNPFVQKALTDREEKVRQMAAWVKEQIKQNNYGPPPRPLVESDNDQTH